MDGFDTCPEPTCPLYGKAVMVDHPHLDTPAARRRRDPDRLVTVTLPLSHWQQIVSDIENMCGTGDHAEIEILSRFTVTEPVREPS